MPSLSFLHSSLSSLRSFSSVNCGFYLILLVRKKFLKGLILTDCRNYLRCLTFLSAGTKVVILLKFCEFSSMKMMVKYAFSLEFGRFKKFINLDNSNKPNHSQ